VTEFLLGLPSAGRFLTIVPIPGPETDATRARSYVWFPVIGALLGLAAAGAFLLGHLVAPPLGSVAAVLTLAGLTGALHLDGLADCADSLGARDRESALAVMRDSRLGTYGSVALMGLVLAKVAVLWDATPEQALRWLVTAAALSRLSPLVLAVLSRYARREGIGVVFVDAVTWPTVLGALALPLAIALLATGPAGLASLGVQGLLVLLVRQWATRRFGGVTGDVMGASIELTEVSALCVCALFR
jgi:adenosylcobinamide-GDP ribazoletransferase